MEPTSCNYWRLWALGLMLCTEGTTAARSPQMPAREQSPLTPTREKPWAAAGPAQSKINQSINNFCKKSQNLLRIDKWIHSCHRHLHLTHIPICSSLFSFWSYFFIPISCHHPHPPRTLGESCKSYKYCKAEKFLCRLCDRRGVEGSREHLCFCESKYFIKKLWSALFCTNSATSWNN